VAIFKYNDVTVLACSMELVTRAVEVETFPSFLASDLESCCQLLEETPVSGKATCDHKLEQA